MDDPDWIYHTQKRRELVLKMFDCGLTRQETIQMRWHEYRIDEIEMEHDRPRFNELQTFVDRMKNLSQEMLDAYKAIGIQFKPRGKE